MENIIDDMKKLTITTKKSKNKELLEKWMENGNTIPVCINQGCNKKVQIRHWSAQEIPSLKTECSTCATARKNNRTLQNIIFHKKIYCENKDGRLGFICPIDIKRCSEFPSDCFDMDHIDGDHTNNNPDNVMTICKICHARKGKENNDFNSRKKKN